LGGSEGNEESQGRGRDGQGPRISDRSSRGERIPETGPEISDAEMAALLSGALSVKPEPMGPGELSLLLRERNRLAERLMAGEQRFPAGAIALCAGGLALVAIVSGLAGGPAVGALMGSALDIRPLVLGAVLANLALSPLGALAIVLARRSSYAR